MQGSHNAPINLVDDDDDESGYGGNLKPGGKGAGSYRKALPSGGPLYGVKWHRCAGVPYTLHLCLSEMYVPCGFPHLESPALGRAAVGVQVVQLWH